jgi:outer membrane protease
MRSPLTALVLTAVLGSAALATTARAADLARSDLFEAEPAALLRTETLTVEAFGGYLNGIAREYVYNVPGDGKKLSQLDWRMDSFALGGRVAFRPLDWLTVRARGWSTVAGSSDMTDYDWFYGYNGMNSWSHRSISQTDTVKAWQADVSLAAGIYDAGDLSFSAIAGYRHFNAKWKAVGGSYVYSSPGNFRDVQGVFPAGQLGISYEQTWRTPYLGLGMSTSSGDWSFSGELTGSPFVMSDDKDHHVLRSLVFREKFGLSGMVGASASAEYRITPLVSLVGRAEYQNYLGATGSTRIADGNAGAIYHYPRPSAGADAETVLVSLGVKARM